MDQHKNLKDYYDLKEKIKDTNYGSIYKADNKKTNEKKAIKIIKKNKIKNDLFNQYLRDPTNEEMKSYIDRYLKEIDYMKIMEGKNEENNNIVKYYEHFENDDNFAMVMELCDDNLLNFSISDSFKPEEIFDILNQLNNSFKIMNENKLVHRDLNLKNILIKYENKEKQKYILKLKFNYYGCFLNDLHSNYKSTKKHGNLNFIAPEILKGEEYNEKVDLWSLGVIIYALSFKNNPYKSNNKNELLNEIKNDGQNKLKKTINSELNDLMSKLLIEDPSKRITWEEYFNHPFFKNNNFKDSSLIKNRKNEDYKKYYEIIKEIGTGGFGHVYEAKDKETNEKRALKIIDKDTIREDFMIENIREMDDEEMESYIQDFIKETKYMEMIQEKGNKNTVRFYEYFDNENEFIIVMELCDENLVKNIVNKNQSYNIKQIYEFLSQLNNTFKIMNENKIAHRDLKLENILIKHENKGTIYSLSDYGLSNKLLSISKKFSTKVGTFSYMAPEVIEGKPYDNKCDLWSLGVIIYQLFFKKFPYNGEAEYAVLQQIKDNGQKMLDTTNNIDLDDLIRKMLVKDPEKRITWKEYFDHPFFKQKKNN